MAGRNWNTKYGVLQGPWHQALGLRGEAPGEENHPFNMETDKKDPQSLCLPAKHASLQTPVNSAL